MGGIIVRPGGAFPPPLFFFFGVAVISSSVMISLYCFFPSFPSLDHRTKHASRGKRLKRTVRFFFPRSTLSAIGPSRLLRFFFSSTNGAEKRQATGNLFFLFELKSADAFFPFVVISQDEIITTFEYLFSPFFSSGNIRDLANRDILSIFLSFSLC